MPRSRETSSVHTKGLPARGAGLDRAIRRAAREVLREHGIKAYALSITLVDDEEMRGINRRAFGRRGSTDVIAFDLSEEGLPCGVVGDVYISLDRARENSLRFAVGEREEIVRLVVHGVLHVIGFEDGTRSLRRAMETEQERIVSRLACGKAGAKRERAKPAL
jgi:probable rRNA maturation factor